MSEAQDRELLGALLNDPLTPDHEIEEVYLRLVGPRIFAMAYERHLVSGRGAVSIDLRGRGWRGLDGPLRMMYVPAGEMQVDGVPVFPEISELIAGYDPASDVVVMVLYDEGVSFTSLSYAGPDNES